MKGQYSIRTVCVILMLLMGCVLDPNRGNAQGIPVIDAYNNALGATARFLATASEVIQRDIMPWKERVGKIQDFFRKANEKIGVVVKNLAMTRRLIETEADIRNLFIVTRARIEAAPGIVDRWRHIWILTSLWREALMIFEEFDLVYKEGQSVMDDDGRIIIIRDALKKALTVRSAMKLVVRRINRETGSMHRQIRERALYKHLFSGT